MVISLDSNIFKKIKNHIRVTWNYQDQEILDMINDGIAKITDIAGSTDYTKGQGMKLLKAYCRYAWDGSEAFFEQNYQRELLQLQFYNIKYPYKEVQP